MAPSKPRNAIWIAWEHQIRNRSLSARLDAELHVFVRAGPRVIRYAECVARTISVLWRQRPALVFGPNPSIVLSYLLLLLRPVFGYRYVSDAHYAGVVASDGRHLLQRLLDFCNRRADLVIVTNEQHRKRVAAIGGNALVCEDPLPDLSGFLSIPLASKKVFFICSFDVDEPYLAVFRAAKLLREEGFTICVSGNFRKVGIDPGDYPDVRFLGFVPESEFYRNLASSEVVVDLTTQDDCLVCGGYEAMALDKPLVTSDQPALRRYFAEGTRFVDEDPVSIVAGIRSAYRDRVALGAAIKEWRAKATVENAERVRAIKNALKADR